MELEISFPYLFAAVEFQMIISTLYFGNNNFR